jgi:phosphatidylinositol alpha-1,6-mannosyltransferase
VTRCYLAFAVFAAALGLFSGQPVERCWGTWAAFGYAAAAMIMSLSSRPGQAGTGTSRRAGRGIPAAAAHGVALAFATIAPLAWQAWAGLPSRVGEGSLTVVARAGAQLVRHGSPYLPAAGLSHVLAYDPYEPLMAVFGLPDAAGLSGWAGNPRLWLTLAGIAGIFAGFLSQGGGGATAVRNTAFAVASPVISLQMLTGGTDVPVIALLCASLALAGRRPAEAAVTAGLACALKATAWPAVPVLAAMLAASAPAGRASARGARFAVIAALTAVPATAAAAPAALRDPGGALQNMVLFPLGLARHRTPAASPLPGHLLAAAGPGGRLAALAMLAAAAAALAWWLVKRPPRDTGAATARLAVALAALFTLAPASRWGYFAYPLALTGWGALTGQARTLFYSSERAVVTPSESPDASTVTAVSPVSLPAASSGSVSAVAAWSAVAASTAPRAAGERTTIGRSGRRWASTNQTSPVTVKMTAMYRFSRRPRMYTEESIRTDSSKIRNME